MSAVRCINPECSQLDIPKDNPLGFPADTITCGTCGGPAAPVDGEPTVEHHDDVTP